MCSLFFVFEQIKRKQLKYINKLELRSTTTQKIMRKNRRKEEQQVRQHAHKMDMNVMRARVKSNKLLLEGRDLPTLTNTSITTIQTKCFKGNRDF